MKNATQQTPEQIQQQLEAMGFSLTSTKPIGGVDDKWPHIAYTVTLSFKGREILTTPYKLGVGHVKVPKRWEDLHEKERFTADEICVFNTLRNKPFAELKDKALHASFVAKLASVQKVAPKLADVLHSLCSDGDAYFNAQSFEEWASDLGYDTDSRKAEAIYQACNEIGRKLARGIPDATLETIREILSNY